MILEIGVWMGSVTVSLSLLKWLAESFATLSVLAEKEVKYIGTQRLWTHFEVSVAFLDISYQTLLFNWLFDLVSDVNLSLNRGLFFSLQLKNGKQKKKTVFMSS